MLLDHLLVSFDCRLLFELTAEHLSAFLELLGDHHDSLLGLRQFVLIGDALELVSLLHESSILSLNVALLLHHLGDLFAHHLGHFFTHVVFQV